MDRARQTGSLPCRSLGDDYLVGGDVGGADKTSPAVSPVLHNLAPRSRELIPYMSL